MKQKRQIGSIVSWKKDQGYGFIHPLKGGSDLFLHINDIQEKVEPAIGSIYSFVIQQDKKGNPIAAFAQPHKPKFWQAISWVGLTVAVALPFSLSIYIFNRLIFPLIFYAIMSVVGFLMHHEDKRRADKQLWRIPDDSMHLVEFLGGWPGSLIGQQVYHLKARKKAYQGVLRFIIFLHAIWWVDFLFLNCLILKLIIQALEKISCS